MSGPCTDCGGPDYQTLVARITKLEADLKDAARSHTGMMEEATTQRLRAEQTEAELVNKQKEIVAALQTAVDMEAERDALRRMLTAVEAENERLRTALVAIQSTTPGSAHRIAIQALSPRIYCEDVDEEYCEQCDGHNRCGDEEAAGFGNYGMDDPREDR